MYTVNVLVHSYAYFVVITKCVSVDVIYKMFKITSGLLTSVQVAVILNLCVSRVGATPLDDYVNRLDDTYKYDVIDVDKKFGYTMYTVNMTSQTWKQGMFSCILVLK